MEEILIAFTSRTDAFRFSDMLSRASLPNQIVNTPRAVNGSCGISVKTALRYVNYVRSFLSPPFPANTLIGVYEITRGVKPCYKRIL